MPRKVILSFIILLIGIICFSVKVQAVNENQIIEDGIYMILSAINSNLAITVKDSSNSNMSNVEVVNAQNMMNQKFKITYLDNGYYKIEAIHSGKVLDVYAALKENGTNVEQYEWNSTDAQKWKIQDEGNGYYSFVSKCNGLYLDVYAGLNKSGTNIQVYAGNNSNAQKFKIEKEKSPEKTIDDGLYTIHMSSNTNKVLQILNDSKENFAPIGIYEYNKNVTQKFYVSYIGDGYYQIKSGYSNKALDVYAGLKKSGTAVDLYEWNNSDAQKWIIQDEGNGYYSIISRCNKLCLDIYGGYTTNGTKAQVYFPNGTDAQKFKFIKEEELIPAKIVEDGIYVIKPSYNSSKTLEVQNGSYGNFANIQINSNTYSQNQKFKIEQIDSSGYYRIIAIDSGKALDVYAGKKENGTNLNQYDWNGSDAQKWIIKEAGKDRYTFISKGSELAIDVYAASSSVGTNVQTYMPNNSSAQQFTLEKVQIITDGEYEIDTKLKENQILDIAGGDTSNAVGVQIWEASNVDQQKFILKFLNGVYTITAKHSNKVLTVGENGNIYQYDYTGELGQQWDISSAGEGYYYIFSKLNNFYINVENSYATNGTRLIGIAGNNFDAQKFKFSQGTRRFYEEGIYGKSGLKVIGDSRGTDLKYYKFGKGSNVLFATYSIHGFEDSYNYDGVELTYISNEFKNYLANLEDQMMFYNWTIYLFPTLNPDGQVYGWTNNGPGRTSLVSAAPGYAGIDMNRNWQIDGQDYPIYKDERNYNGTSGFQAYEVKALRDFLLEHRALHGQTILIDLHGWLNETIGDNEIGEYYRNQYGMTKHVGTYGRGYLVNWAKESLGGTNRARAALIELPEVKSHTQAVQQNLSGKYINATMQMLNDLGNTKISNSFKIMSRSISKEINNQTQFETALSGVLENDEQAILEKQGIFVTEKSREKFMNMLIDCNIKAFKLNENGYIQKDENINIENEFEQQLEKMIINGKTYIIDISDICYMQDTTSGRTIKYPFTELDDKQICEPFEDENNILLVVTTNNNNKLKNSEIINTILQY